MGEVGGLRAGTVSAEKAASAAERIGLESAETAANAAKADRMAAEASIATDSSPKITVTGTEPVKPFTNGGAPYVNAEQANIGGSLTQTSTLPRVAGKSSVESTELAAEAERRLLSSISEFSSTSQAGKSAAMVGAYDSATGKIAIGSSNNKIVAKQLHPLTVEYIEN